MKKGLKFNLIYTGLVLLLVGLISVLTYNNYLENKYPWHIYQNNSYKLLKEYSGKDVTMAFLDTGLSEELIESFGDRIVNPYNVIDGNTNVIDVN